jgi:putative nucleotidyltransferase with HDIG domain
MTNRPTKRVITGEWIALAVAAALTAALVPSADWDLPLFAMLLALGVISDIAAIDVASHKIKVSGSFLAIVAAAVFLGPALAAVIGVLTIVAGWVHHRYAGHILLINVVTYAWFPLAAGGLFHLSVNGLDLGTGDSVFYLLVFGLFVLALAIDFALIAGYFAYQERSSFKTKVQRSLVPVLPSELASALLTVGIAYAYAMIGITAIAMFGIVLGVFQYLLGALLVSQERADELEVRAKQLAGFQVALLSALLRTLDLRDRMTARHSAAVARYARETAARSGMSDEQQELAHTAGLLHDIGKFVLPDDILKSRTALSPEQWNEVRRHPYEGARIVSQIDGYTPVGDIILAHHERLDGLGYPRGLQGDQIPEISRIIAVVDSYDAMTARDSYRRPMSSFEAISELRRVSGTQLDARFVTAFIEVLSDKDVTYKHGEDADFEAELALDRRIHEYVNSNNGNGTTESAAVEAAAP